LLRNLANVELVHWPKHEPNMSKEKNHKKSKLPGERLFINISSTKHISSGNSKFWLFSGGQCYRLLLEQFLKSTAKVMTDLVKHLKDIDRKTVMTSWCDNARENEAFQILVAEQ